MQQVTTRLPKVTVVTVCYNACSDIRTTIESVIGQTYANLEYVIVDGGSTDGTVDIVQEYRDKYPIVFVSERDGGIFDAMNKGVNLSSGKWVNFMNSGDYFVANDVVEKISEYLDDTHDLVYGMTQFLYRGFSVVRKPRPISDFRVKMPYNHQSLFSKRDLLLEHPFDLRYPLSADYEQVLYAVVSRKVFHSVPITVAAYNDYGISGKKTALAIEEYVDILRSYGKLTPWHRAYYVVLPLKGLKRTTPNCFRRLVYRHFVR